MIIRPAGYIEITMISPPVISVIRFGGECYRHDNDSVHIEVESQYFPLKLPGSLRDGFLKREFARSVRLRDRDSGESK